MGFYVVFFQPTAYFQSLLFDKLGGKELAAIYSCSAETQAHLSLITITKADFEEKCCSEHVQCHGPKWTRKRDERDTNILTQIDRTRIFSGS